MFKYLKALIAIIAVNTFAVVTCYFEYQNVMDTKSCIICIVVLTIIIYGIYAVATTISSHIKIHLEYKKEMIKWLKEHNDQERL